MPGGFGTCQPLAPELCCGEREALADGAGRAARKAAAGEEGWQQAGHPGRRSRAGVRELGEAAGKLHSPQARPLPGTPFPPEDPPEHQGPCWAPAALPGGQSRPMAERLSPREGLERSLWLPMPGGCGEAAGAGPPARPSPGDAGARSTHAHQHAPALGPASDSPRTGNKGKRGGGKGNKKNGACITAVALRAKGAWPIIKGDRIC